jgi:hypothetical protein
MGRLNSEQKGGRLDMGKTTSKKMIPLLILRILWKHADKENMLLWILSAIDWKRILKQKEE